MDPRAELLDQLDCYEAALAEVYLALGPTVPKCTGCMGCSYEMEDALNAAREALERFGKLPKAYNRPGTK